MHRACFDWCFNWYFFGTVEGHSILVEALIYFNFLPNVFGAAFNNSRKALILFS